MKKSLILAAATLAAFTLVGCNSSSKTTSGNGDQNAKTMQTAGKPVNAKCPVSGEEVPANATTVSYQGKTVGFCCDHCVAKWNAMSDAEKQQKLAAAK